MFYQRLVALAKNRLFLCGLLHLAGFNFFILFSPIECSLHLVVRCRLDLNPCPKTMAGIVSCRRSPLDQGLPSCQKILLRQCFENRKCENHCRIRVKWPEYVLLTGNEFDGKGLFTAIEKQLPPLQCGTQLLQNSSTYVTWQKKTDIRTV